MCLVDLVWHGIYGHLWKKDTQKFFREHGEFSSQPCDSLRPMASPQGMCCQTSRQWDPLVLVLEWPLLHQLSCKNSWKCWVAYKNAFAKDTWACKKKKKWQWLTLKKEPFTQKSSKYHWSIQSSTDYFHSMEGLRQEEIQRLPYMCRLTGDPHLCKANP